MLARIFRPRRQVLVGMVLSGLVVLGACGTSQQQSNHGPKPTPSTANLFFATKKGSVYGLNAASGKAVWSYHARGEVDTPPLVVGQSVIFGSNDHTLYAVSGQTGKLQWRFKAGDAILEAPVSSNGVVYVGSLDHRVYALRVEDGKLLWQHTLSDGVSASPAVADGTIFVGSLSSVAPSQPSGCASGVGCLYAFDAVSGRLKWKAQTGDSIESSPVIAGGIVYAATADTNPGVYAVDEKTGSLVWRFGTQDRVFTSVAVDQSRVFAVDAAGMVYALNASNGSQQWNKSTLGALQGGFSVAFGGVLYVTAGDVYALREDSGKVLWEFSPSGATWSAPAIVGNALYISASNIGASAGNEVDAINKSTGSLLWRYRPPGQPQWTPTVFGKTVVASGDKSLYAFDAATGKQVWRFSADSEIMTAATSR